VTIIPHAGDEDVAWDIPAAVDELQLQIYQLGQRVAVLESELQRVLLHKSSATGLANLESVTYHIERLYVRELSGTLNIGLTSIGDSDTSVSDFIQMQSRDGQSPLDDVEVEGDMATRSSATADESSSEW